MKPFKTFDEQIDILVSRGLMISDKSLALRTLKNINYYKLSIYLRPFFINERFTHGVCFEDALALYEFDSSLRNLLALRLEKIEGFLKTQIAYWHSSFYGADGYLNPANYKPGEMAFLGFITLIKQLEGAIKQSDEVFVRHHKKQVTSMPFWVSIELLTFGQCVKLYDNLTQKVKRKIVHNYGKPEVFVTDLRHAVRLRNICAHGARLYNRKFNDKTYAINAVLAAVRMIEFINPQDDLRLNIKAACQTLSDKSELASKQIQAFLRHF